ncbi:MAG TPA: low molecular weight protein-tyrosine-phosphatase, partial [Ignavibacteriaceae bacterium]|nr:low molecular weight protein-tyrosine-phosphatase [Ignavibacteriaceae bacterium]
MKKKKVLFVCLGNICRSPSAEGVLKKFIKDEHLEDKIEVDSCGTIDYHQGETPDSRTQRHALKRGYILNHRAKKFIPEKDFVETDYIVAMDNSNYSDILSFDTSNKFRNKVYKLSQFSDKIKFNEVPDPYYKGAEGFEEVLDL